MQASWNKAYTILWFTLELCIILAATTYIQCRVSSSTKVDRLERLSLKVCKGEPYEDPIYNRYRMILVSKQTEESLAKFASWEPRHGKFRWMHPWKDYFRMVAMLRHCAYAVSALHGCLLSEIQKRKYQSSTPTPEMLNQLSRREKEVGIKRDPDVDVFMNVKKQIL